MPTIKGASVKPSIAKKDTGADSDATDADDNDADADVKIIQNSKILPTIKGAFDKPSSATEGRSLAT